jgi:hypothetical protein
MTVLVVLSLGDGSDVVGGETRLSASRVMHLGGAEHPPIPLWDKAHLNPCQRFKAGKELFQV